ncbi:hypothetical protein KKG31_00920 [Patescibacteria group bacterium]|nr:hypothetical protein [Patescibacteria group bacterium]MBU1757743.1 hypothetical protein [Patescibacteria group bacterium]
MKFTLYTKKLLITIGLALLMFTSYLSFASALGNYGGNEPFYDASIVGSNEDTLEIA